MHIGIGKHQPAIDEQDALILPTLRAALLRHLLDGHAVAADLAETTEENNALTQALECGEDLVLFVKNGTYPSAGTLVETYLRIKFGPLKENDFVLIPKKSKHYAKSTGKGWLKVLVISSPPWNKEDHYLVE